MIHVYEVLLAIAQVPSYIPGGGKVFLATHLSTTQISHNAIRNPTTGRSNPMSFQKACGGVSQKMICTFTKSAPVRSSWRRSHFRCAAIRSPVVRGTKRNQSATQSFAVDHMMP